MAEQTLILINGKFKKIKMSGGGSTSWSWSGRNARRPKSMALNSDCQDQAEAAVKALLKAT
jgi:hypothetical protein